MDRLILNKEMIRALFISLVIYLFALSAVAAQEQSANDNPQPNDPQVLPESPRELEGFRIDQPATTSPNPGTVTLPPASEAPVIQPESNARPASASESGPVEIPLPPSQSQSSEPAARNVAPRRQVTAPKATSVAPAEDAPVSPATIPPTSTDTAVPVQENPITEDQPASDIGTKAPAFSLTDWRLWTALAALLGIFAAFFYWLGSRRQTAPTQMGLDDMLPDIGVAADVVDEDHPIAIDEKSEPLPAYDALKTSPEKEPDPPASSRPPARPQLEMRFAPDKAMLGIAKLTLRGELHIVNHGKAMARNVRLRSAAICACENQERLIHEFCDGGVEEDAVVIDNIRKAERVTVDIEVSLPRSELLSYHVQDRQICVPIMLAELCWSGMRADSADKIQIAALVGTEADPPTDKMGPLRLDLGPRSYGSLGQRLLSV